MPDDPDGRDIRTAVSGLIDVERICSTSRGIESNADKVQETISDGAENMRAIKRELCEEGVTLDAEMRTTEECRDELEIARGLLQDAEKYGSEERQKDCLAEVDHTHDKFCQQKVLVSHI